MEKEKLYRYNREEGTLHIFGCCQYSENPEYEQYDTVGEVASALGYTPALCCICERERDYVVKNEKIYKRRKK